ncbi:hypothetical protein RND71_024442 [Anisodus tanguticus]|uniref:Uncharacterized protein n=1 Tax=Anisodus tanguticus TaxID=243964 RepID=A0AAE1RPM8_9SOLA|nr:hypothetical protein RND71_024442 [Anisodus tanguticus]
MTTVTPPVFISTTTLHTLITHKSLINHLQSSLPTFTSTIESPLRHAHQTSPSSSLLLMPSWSLSPSLPYIGQTLATMDATELTVYRTSCTSALASKYLSRQDSNTLLMIGAGTLAPHLIKAHLTVRPNLKKVIVWNRTADKAKRVIDKLQSEGGFEGVSWEVSGCLEEVVGLGDIVSCATNSETPLVKGEMLKEGAHLDLVGSFKHTMRECDDEALKRGKVFVDNEAAMVEAGELVGAFERGVIRKDEIVGDLLELIKGEKNGRRSDEDITVFKSVGSAVVDLLTAQLAYETYMKSC